MMTENAPQLNNPIVDRFDGAPDHLVFSQKLGVNEGTRITTLEAGRYILLRNNEDELFINKLRPEIRDVDLQKYVNGVTKDLNAEDISILEITRNSSSSTPEITLLDSSGRSGGEKSQERIKTQTILNWHFRNPKKTAPKEKKVA